MKDKIFAEIKRKLPRAVRIKLSRKVEIIFLAPKDSCELNRKFFKKSVPANVLSFRYGSDYGEILVCPEIIRREAKKQGNAYKYQFAWMILHGMIHLAGMHHEGSREKAKRVEKLEERVLGALFHKDKKQ